MTNLELIRMLVKHPPDAVVFAFDAEDGDYRPITGSVTGPEPISVGLVGKPVYRIELQTDVPF